MIQISCVYYSISKLSNKTWVSEQKFCLTAEFFLSLYIFYLFLEETNDIQATVFKCFV